MKQLFKLSFLFVLLWLSSCATRRDILYLQDMDELKEYPVVQKYEAVIQRDDKLNIKVTSKNPELALAFNLPGVGGYTVDAQGNINATGTTDSELGYIVDVNGDINFPILGKLHVEGLSRNQLTDLIRNRLIEEELLRDPVVVVDLSCGTICGLKTFSSLHRSTYSKMISSMWSQMADRVVRRHVVGIAYGPCLFQASPH